MTESNHRSNKRKSTVTSVLTMFLLAFGILFLFSMFWLFKTFPNVNLDELIYQITAPIEGTNVEMIQDYLWTALLPSVVIFVICFFFYWILKERKGMCKKIYTVLAAILIAFSSTVIYTKLDVQAYLKANSKENRMFIEQNYVDPATTEITFPEQKRNLLYIYLESVETTFASKDVGGAFDENLIPELTQLSIENESFAGDSGQINGAIALSGSTWTVGSMFSGSSGLPLKVSLDGNSMNTQSQFFGTTTTMGDVLLQNGYKNTLLIGSDANFGGRKLYYTTHGDYEILDLEANQKAHRLPTDDYHVWWGFEDMYLYQIAQEKLTELGNSDQPFNLTMLTVDTHFQDGYKCALCGNEHPDNPYADVYSCASRQLGSFIEWCKAQPWYANTTIVITGDHPTMDGDFCSDVDPNYQRRVFTTILNSSADNAMPESYRVYSTFDLFPTTLASLGAEISGNRLGLGTNLYSGARTLTEEYGVEDENVKLMARSKFMKERAAIEKIPAE